MEIRFVTAFTATVVLPALLLATGGAASAAESSAFIPARDQVIENQLLPPSAKRAVRALADANSTSLPSTQRDRITAARRLIEDGRQAGDPRTLGYAEQILLSLSPSTTTADAVDVLVLKATIEQSRHRFDAATALLDSALERDPNHLQARLTRATVAQVRGQHVAARGDCQRLSAAVADVCTASVDSLIGKNDRALATLGKVAAQSDPAMRSWALSISGDILAQSGDAAEAVRAYTRSLALSDDLYTRVALADALLDLKRFDAALAVLSGAPITDAVLLRRWRALRQKDPKGEALADITRQLAGRIAAAETRGETLHVREAAWFALESGDPRRALVLARVNWATQREPADVQLLATAARAAGDREARREVTDWIAASGLRDVRVDRALNQPGA